MSGSGPKPPRHSGRGASKESEEGGGPPLTCPSHLQQVAQRGPSILAHGIATAVQAPRLRRHRPQGEAMLQAPLTEAHPLLELPVLEQLKVRGAQAGAADQGQIGPGLLQRASLCPQVRPGLNNWGGGGGAKVRPREEDRGTPCVRPPSPSPCAPRVFRSQVLSPPLDQLPPTAPAQAPTHIHPLRPPGSGRDLWGEAGEDPIPAPSRPPSPGDPGPGRLTPEQQEGRQRGHGVSLAPAGEGGRS